jgi:hypothetical protein
MAHGNGRTDFASRMLSSTHRNASSAAGKLTVRTLFNLVD